jgi:ribonuclease J
MLKIIPMGGLGEIGLNMMVVEYGDVIFIIDAGLMFPEDYMLGVDIVIPAIDYIRENKDKVKAVVITHAHEDHIGALPYLLKEMRLPIYGTAFTLAMIKHKLIEFELDSVIELNLINPGETLTIDPFEIEFIRVSHSTVDGVGLAIKTPEGLIIHTGDFRITHDADMMKNTDIARFARFGEKGVLALMSDSTNVEVEGYSMSEQEVANNLEKYVIEAPGRVMVALFASNVHRIQQLIDIAVRNRRKVVFIGRSMVQILHIASELRYITCPENTIIDVKQIENYKDEELIFITTGSQGEPMSALARMASGIHKYIRIKKGDGILLSSRNIPGNEKAISNIINKLYHRGAEVIYTKISRIHSSGHAHNEELRLMLNLIRPQYFIPIHGEYRHLVIHARLAEKLGIPKENVLVAENGNVIAFDNTGGRFHSSVYTGRVLVDGKGIGDVGRSILKERWEMAEGGLVVVTLIIDEETGFVLHGPELISKGFVFDAAKGYLVDDAQCVILEIVEEIDIFRKDRIELLKKKLQKALRQYFSFAINRKPLIVPIIVEV